MAREGIYIGGHEIIERYVGNKLVWSKKKWKLIATLTFDDVNVYSDGTVRFTGTSTGNFKGDFTAIGFENQIYSFDSRDINYIGGYYDTINHSISGNASFYFKKSQYVSSIERLARQHKKIGLYRLE